MSDLPDDIASHEMRVLLLPTTGRDAVAIEKVLKLEQMQPAVFTSAGALCEALGKGAGAVVISEEALAINSVGLLQCIAHQPVWSDVPIIILSRSGVESPTLTEVIPKLGNVSVLERPVRINTLLSIIRSALRGRMRQYQVRAQLGNLERSESALRQAKHEADVANGAKDHFLAVLSHELRTPLTPVLATAQLLETDDRLSDEHHDMVQMIRRNVELEARLIDDLLDLTRVARNKLELHLSTVDIHEKIRHVVRICEEEISAKRLKIHLELSAEQHMVSADPARLQQIIWNLLKNAVKFTSLSGAITIRTHDAVEQRVAVEIVDNGVGIPAETLPHIFDAFEQGGRQVTRQFGGLGLGLAISKALVEMHGGTIAASSGGADRGATFTFMLPLTNVSTHVPRPSAAGENRRLTCSILLVEDHADTRRVMARVLGRLGCDVKTAGSVAEALELVGSQAFDLLISDIGLPDASGLELMEKVRSRFDLKGIALSGYGMDDDVNRSREAGFVAHLTKPVNLQEVEETVRQLVMI